MQCPGEAGAIDAVIEDARPQDRTSLILRRDGVVVPPSVLAAHLSRLGLPSQLLGTGHLLVAILSPGQYDVFLGRTPFESIVSGSSEGLIGSVAVRSAGTTELPFTAQSVARTH